ncbi:hypothetical protein Tsubulata_038029 [Turnera subulata]|uniref:AN1-type domain-containing protein n=1 Tax=Turnera subulata TaxID=218843 RepID=A0A9Q0J7K2_9ROSI|nr:hypothetical protein Tsubulata_038029 [Turnera subulata]
MPLVSELEKYLGVPLLHGQAPRGRFQFTLDGIRHRLSGWQGKHLSLAGRMTLVQSTISAIPLHPMQAAWLPEHICNQIDQLARQFLWARGASNASTPAAADKVSPTPSNSITADSVGKASPAAIKNRCEGCNKKVGLTGFACRCGEVFCGKHRYPKDHCCTFDFRTLDRELLVKQNPLVQADKLGSRV